jgi:hypothetical protein
MTQAEQLDSAKRAGDIKRQIKNERNELAALKSVYDEKKKLVEKLCDETLEPKLDELMDAVTDGEVYRDVACQRVFDYRVNTVSEYRTDYAPTQLIGEPRPMNSAEIQLGLTLDDGRRIKQSKPEKSKGKQSNDDIGIVDDGYPGQRLDENDDDDENDLNVALPEFEGDPA